MKIHHFTIIFSILALSAVSLCESYIEASDSRKLGSQRYDIAFDRACDAATAVLRGEGEYLTDEMIRNAEAVFGNSLCAYFGVSAFSQEGRMLLQKVPVIAVTCPDGIYVGYLFDENGTVIRRWTQKLLYSQISQEKIFEDYFLEPDLNKDVNGRALKPEFPDDDLGLFQRNAHEIGFTAFYRSPVQTGTGASYTYASSVSEITGHYYVNISGTGYSSGMYYHLDGCKYKNSECMEFNSRRECAENGAFCCPECRDILF